MSLISSIFLILHFLLKKFIFVSFKLLLNLFKLFFRNDSEPIKTSHIIAFDLCISCSEIKIKNSVSISISQAIVWNEHKINCIKMSRFPFNVSLIDTKFIFFCLVIKYQTIIFMRKALNIFVKKELYNIVFLAVKTEEVFHLQ